MHGKDRALLLAFLLFARPVSGQNAPLPRHGEYFGFGTGYGLVMAKLGATTDLISGWMFYADGGGTINRHWRLGGEFDYGGGKLSNTGSAYFYSLTIAAAFYPSLQSNFWTKANLGIGMLRPSGNSTDGHSSGWSGGVGIGYDYFTNPSGKDETVTSPFINWIFQFTDASRSAAIAPGTRGQLLQVGLIVGSRH